MSISSSPKVEAQLLRQLADIELKISELTQERKALQRVITRIREAKLDRPDATRKNSFRRILVENGILEALRASTVPLSSDDLFAVSRRIHFDMKPTTFRSHLYRMKLRGLIVPARTHGHWTPEALPPTSENS